MTCTDAIFAVDYPCIMVHTYFLRNYFNALEVLSQLAAICRLVIGYFSTWPLVLEPNPDDLGSIRYRSGSGINHWHKVAENFVNPEWSFFRVIYSRNFGLLAISALTLRADSVQLAAVAVLGAGRLRWPGWAGEPGPGGQPPEGGGGDAGPLHPHQPAGASPTQLISRLSRRYRKDIQFASKFARHFLYLLATFLICLEGTHW